MSKAGAERANETAAAAGETLSWTCHPSRRNYPKTLAVVGLLAALMLFTIWYTGSAFFGVVVVLVMTLSLGAYFFPTWYTLTEKGIKVRTLVTKFERPWSTYRSFWPDKNGVLLSPFPHASRLENFRGLFVRFEGNGKDVVAFVKRYVPEPEA